jgi:hypothetical protein
MRLLQLMKMREPKRPAAKRARTMEAMRPSMGGMSLRTIQAATPFSVVEQMRPALQPTEGVVVGMQLDCLEPLTVDVEHHVVEMNDVVRQVRGVGAVVVSCLRTTGSTGGMVAAGCLLISWPFVAVAKPIIEAVNARVAKAGRIVRCEVDVDGWSGRGLSRMRESWS